jgi:hypothetical protein
LAKAELHDAILHGAQTRRASQGRILKAIQVEQAVHGVKSYFLIDGLAVTAGIRLSGLRADDDFTMGESDDVGWAAYSQKPLMHARDDAIGDDGHFDFRQGTKREGFVRRMRKTFFQSDRREPAQPIDIAANGALTVLNIDHVNPAVDGMATERVEKRTALSSGQAAVIGTVDFDAGTGVSCLSPLLPRPVG